MALTQEGVDGTWIPHRVSSVRSVSGALEQFFAWKKTMLNRSHVECEAPQQVIAAPNPRRQLGQSASRKAIAAPSAAASAACGLCPCCWYLSTSRPLHNHIGECSGQSTSRKCT